MTKPTCKCWIKRNYYRPGFSVNGGIYYARRRSPYYEWHGYSDDKDTIWQFCPICGDPAEEVKP